jgi:hypothetical protein
MAPLIELRHEMGPIAAAWFRRDTLTRRFRVVPLVGLAAAGLIVLGSIALPA